MTGLVNGEEEPPPRYTIESSMEVATVTADFPVGFRLLTAGDMQYIAYYDKDRNMTVASRQLDSEEWKYQVLPSKVGWDSHNYITIAVDTVGHLHVSGNMHNVPLIYFRTATPGDISTLTQHEMTGEEEDKVTYPRFLADHEGNLLFNYRNGASGKGMRILNKYDPASRTWSRLLDKPLLDGEGERNAYPLYPARGPEGWFHLVWVWRDTPDCATNHHLSHARSRDMVHWESVFGDKIELPMVLGMQSLWVDPIPSGGGIINGCERLFFDDRHRPIITYHKSDPDGNMQIYATRKEGDAWIQHVLTDWETPVHFSGYGTMGFIGIKISGLTRIQPGILMITYKHRDYGEGRVFVDEDTLQPIEKEFAVQPEFPSELDQVVSSFEGMEIKRAFDKGNPEEEGVRYLLQWETLGKNHDRPRTTPLPPPSTLKLYKLSRNN